MVTRQISRKRIIERIKKQMKKEKKYQSLVGISKATQTHYYTTQLIINDLEKEGQIQTVETTSGKFYSWKH